MGLVCSALGEVDRNLIKWRLFNPLKMKFPVFLLTLVGLSSTAVEITTCSYEDRGMIEKIQGYECFGDRSSRCSGSTSTCACNRVKTTIFGQSVFNSIGIGISVGQGGWNCWTGLCSEPSNWNTASSSSSLEFFPCCDCNFGECEYKYIFNPDGSGEWGVEVIYQGLGFGTFVLDSGFCNAQVAGQPNSGSCYGIPESCCQTPRDCLSPMIP